MAAEPVRAPVRRSPLRQAGALLARRWEEGLAIAALIVVVSCVVWGILSRVVLPHAATWTAELATLAFCWTVFFGAAASFRRDMHIRVDLLVLLVPERPRAAVELLVNLIVLAFLGYVFWYAVLLSISSVARPSPILRIPFSWIYGAVAVSLGSMILHQLVVLFRTAVTQLSAPENRA